MRQGYLFNGSATGLAGHLTKPFDHVIESQAPAALASVGGYSGARVPGFHFKEILSFRAAYTQVAGSFSEETKSWDTITTSTVEGLEILGVLQVERLVARIATRHSIDPDTPDSIRPVGSTIEGLSIGGVTPTIIWNRDLIHRLDTYRKVVDAYEDPERDFKKRYDASQGIGDSEAGEERHRHLFPWKDRKRGQEIPNKGGILALSLVEAVAFPDDTIASRGHVFYVPQFGTIALAQYLEGPWGARIDMVRVELGCAVQGSVVAGSGSTTGQPMPPPRGN